VSQAQDQKRFTISEVAYWPAMTLGGAALVAAPIARMNGLWTRNQQLDPELLLRIWSPSTTIYRILFTLETLA